jgi:hypothetical protein
VAHVEQVKSFKYLSLIFKQNHANEIEEIMSYSMHTMQINYYSKCKICCSIDRPIAAYTLKHGC